MARRYFWAAKLRMPVHSAPSRPFATCSVHDQSSGSDFTSQYAMASTLLRPGPSRDSPRSCVLLHARLPPVSGIRVVDDSCRRPRLADVVRLLYHEATEAVLR